MEPDGKQIKIIKREKEKIGVFQRLLIDVSHVLPTSGLRCSIQDYDGNYRFVLGCRRSLLFNFRLFLVVLYIAYEAVKQYQ